MIEEESPIKLNNQIMRNLENKKADSITGSGNLVFGKSIHNTDGLKPRSKDSIAMQRESDKQANINMFSNPQTPDANLQKNHT